MTPTPCQILPSADPPGGTRPFRPMLYGLGMHTNLLKRLA
jgi:hypothetical protein